MVILVTQSDDNVTFLFVRYPVAGYKCNWPPFPQLAQMAFLEVSIRLVGLSLAL